ncbi:chorismate mutase [Amycolatopsis sp. BJA-103]|uniref:chorismate mutase n=1 Tax=Amycolatopsis sp. BJA-103 TaxID=1911175 RepID=UPI000C75B70D|nr:chorismate mutase [Amycolatopsis sp. BJA-103]AUI63719.1 chorismate mutase [Amycolatopsis sp. BJA-103]PNE19564.1 chorismate mutase [Amycolatopsis sp. BJA-103]
MRLRVLCALLVAGLLTVPAPASASSGLWTLTDLAAQRVQIADKVAAAKFGTPSPIDDPVREQQILDSVAAKAPGLGLDADGVVRFFRDQIEANKVVQRGLYARWTEHPGSRPPGRPDLATEVRPVIDRLNAGLLAELAATRSARARPSCDARLAVTVRLVDARRDLDRLHAGALGEAVRSACAQP